MLLCYSDYIRMVVGDLDEPFKLFPDAERNLRSYLGAYIRPEFLEKVQAGSILNPLVGKAEGWLGRGIDGRLFKEDLVDMLIDEKGHEDITAGLLTKADTDFGLGREDAKKLVREGKLPAELEKVMGEAKDSFGKTVYSFLDQFFTRSMKKWCAKHMREVPEEKGEGKEPVVRTEPEDIEEARREQEVGKEFPAAVRDMIKDHSKSGSKKRAIFLALLEHRFMKDKESKKTLTEIAKDTDANIDTVDQFEAELLGLLQGLARQHKLGPKFDIPKSKSDEVPGYQGFMKAHPDDVKDLQKYVKDVEKGQLSEMNIVILDALSEGKGVQEIADKFKYNKNTVQKSKNRYFDDAYEEWYLDRTEGVKVALRRLAAVIQALGKTVRVKAPGKSPGGIDAPEQEAGTAIHDNLVKKMIKDHRFHVTTTFSSDFDHMDAKHEQDTHFKWVHYSVAASEEQKTSGGNVKTVAYRYEHKLEDDGRPAGSGHSIMPGHSVLEIDGEHAKDSDPLKVSLDKYLEEKILPEGAIPHTWVMATFFNKATGKTYKNKDDFLGHFRGLLVPDPAHKGRMLEQEKWERQKDVRPNTTEVEELKALVLKLKRDLKNTVGDDKKKIIKDRIDEVNEMIEKKRTVDLDELDQLIEDEKSFRRDDFDAIYRQLEKEKPTKERRKPSKPPAKEKDDTDTTDTGPDPLEEKSDDDKSVTSSDQGSYDIVMRVMIAAGFPGPQSEDAKKFASLIGDVLGDKELRVWKDNTELIAMMHAARSLVEKKMQAEMKKKKPKGMDKEEWERSQRGIEREYRDDLKSIIGYFPDFVDDLKTRRDMFKKESPDVYANWVKARSVGWIDIPEKVQELKDRVKRESEMPLTKEKEFKQPSVTMLDRTKFKALEGHLQASQKGFDTMAHVLDRASVEPTGGGLEHFEGYKKAINDVRGEQKALEAGVRSLKDKADPSEAKVLEELEDKVKKTGEQLKDMDAHLKILHHVPAMVPARLLQSFSEYFSDLYSDFTSILWYREKYSVEFEPITAEEIEEINTAGVLDKKVSKSDVEKHEDGEIIKHKDIDITKRSDNRWNVGIHKDDQKHEYIGMLLKDLLIHIKDFFAEIKDPGGTKVKDDGSVGKPQRYQDLKSHLKKLKDGIVQHAREIRQYPLKVWESAEEKTKNPIKALLIKLRAGLKELIDGMQSIEAMVKTAEEDLSDLIEDFDDKTAVYRAKPEKDDPSVREFIKKPLKDAPKVIPEKFSIPESVRSEAEEIVEKVKEFNKEDGAKAREQLNDVFKTTTEAFEDLHGPEFQDKIREVAQEKKISPSAAGEQLKRNQELFIKSVVDEFVMVWTDLLNRNKHKREKSPLGHRPSHQYEKICDLVERHMPQEMLSKFPPAEVKPPTMGIPTPKKIREMIEKEWSKVPEPTPEVLKEFYVNEAFAMGEGGGEGGGGGGKSRHRKKNPKPPVPSAVYEQIKASLARHLKSDTPEHFVVWMIMSYITGAKKMLKDIPEDEFIDAFDIVDLIVDQLKKVPDMISKLNVGSSTKTLKSPAVGAPPYSGVPDIAVDTEKERQDMFEKIRVIYRLINDYVEPDHVIPSDSLKNLSKSGIGRKYLPLGLLDMEGEGQAPYPSGTKEPSKEDRSLLGPEYKLKKHVPEKTPYTGPAQIYKEPGEKKAELYDFHSQMSHNIARKFAGVVLTEDESEVIFN